MKEKLQKHQTKLRFGAVGTANTLIDFGILFGLTSLGAPKIGANTVSTTVSFLFSFLANRKFTFKSSSQNVKRQLFLFAVVTLFGLWVIQAIIIGVLTPLFSSWGFSDNLSLLISKTIATLASLVWNYTLYSKVVFKK